jgi:small subunit ribosomal protein S20
MANKRSALKELRKSAKRRLRNQSVKSMLKTLIKSARSAAGKSEAEVLARRACKMLDKAAEHGIIHKNQAARRKSRLMRFLQKAQASSPET